jgi:hypothetical protein
MGVAAAALQPQQLRHFVQRKTDVLCALDEVQPSSRLFAVAPHARGGALGLGQKATPLVVADRLDMHPSRLGEPTNRDCLHCGLLGLTPYLATEFMMAS